MSVAVKVENIEKLVPNLKVVGVDDKVLAYQFTGGVYEGVTFTYARIGFNVVDTETGEPVDIDPEDMVNGDESMSLKVDFEYVVFENTNNKDTETEHFKSYIGNILTTVIESSV